MKGQVVMGWEMAKYGDYLRPKGHNHVGLETPNHVFFNFFNSKINLLKVPYIEKPIVVDQNEPAPTKLLHTR
jgi:hypothetical protein